MKLGFKKTLTELIRNEDGGSSVKISFLGILGLLFIGLKLGGVIAWSWWWVLLPLYGPFAIVLGIILLGLFGFGVGVGILGMSNSFRR